MFTQSIQTYKNAYSGLTRRIWLLGLVMLINRSGTMVLPFMTLYCVQERHFTATMAGVVVTMYGIGSMAGAFIGGWLSDRVGFYRMQLAALFGGGMLFMLFGEMRSYPAMCVCAFFLSLVNEAFRPANASAIAHYSNPENRTRSFSLIRLAINMGWGVGGALGGFLASANYSWLFWVDGATNIFAGLLLWWLIPRPTGIGRPHKTTEKVKAASAYSDTTYLIFIFFMLLFAVCFFQLFTTVPLYFKRGLQLNEFWIGVMMSLNGVLIAVFEMLIVFKLEGKKPYLLLMVYGTLLIACSYAIFNVPLSSGLLLATLSTLLITAGEIVSMPFMNSYYIARTSEHNRGQYAALFTMAWSAAQAIGSSTGTWLIDNWGFTDLWWAITALCLVAAAGYYALLKR
jgi:predicted MFS family arabinose efflux permease